MIDFSNRHQTDAKMIEEVKFYLTRIAKTCESKEEKMLAMCCKSFLEHIEWCHDTIKINEQTLTLMQYPIEHDRNKLN